MLLFEWLPCVEGQPIVPGKKLGLISLTGPRIHHVKDGHRFSSGKYRALETKTLEGMPVAGASARLAEAVQFGFPTPQVNLIKLASGAAGEWMTVAQMVTLRWPRARALTACNRLLIPS